MPLVNQRIARTLEELNDIDYKLSYMPGKDNIVADILSRTPLELKIHKAAENYIPERPNGFIEILTPGGGDSLFQSFSHYLHGNFNSHALIRHEVVTELLKNLSRYGLPIGREAKHELQQLQLTKFPGQLPFTQSIAAFSELNLVKVLVYSSKEHPLYFGISSYQHMYCFYCLSGIHYNLLLPIKGQLPEAAQRVLDTHEAVPSTAIIYHTLQVDEDLNQEINTTQTSEIISRELSPIVDAGGEETPIEVIQSNIIELNNFSLILKYQDVIEITKEQIDDCK